MRKPPPRSNATGSVQEKRGYLYTVISVTIQGKRKQHWQATGLKAKGNRRKAEAILRERIAAYDARYPPTPQPPGAAKRRLMGSDPLLMDYLRHWVMLPSHAWQPETQNSNLRMLNGRIDSFFGPRRITLWQLQPVLIEEFLLYLYDAGLKGSTVLHYYQLLAQAVKDAVRKDMLSTNPFDKVPRPKKSNFTGSYYSDAEVRRLLDVFAPDPLFVVVVLAAIYGLRRSEVLGLHWDDVDFANSCLHIRHKVTQGPRSELIISDQMKTKSSRRTLPLVPFARELLLAERQRQQQNQVLWGKSYVTRYSRMVCVNAQGQLLSPGYVSDHFSLVLRKNELRKIRFHDLRHTCASLLAKNHVDMKYIQRWLGHSNYSTTADIYAHLDTGANELTGQAIVQVLALPDYSEACRPRPLPVVEGVVVDVLSG